MRKRLWLAGAALALLGATAAHAADGPDAHSERPFGLGRRVSWTTSRLTGSPDAPPPYATERVFPKLSFTLPVVLTAAPGSDRWYLGELEGKVWSFPDDAAGERPDLFFDAAAINGFKQLYGLTFHPDFETNRWVYLCYVLEPERPDGTRVSRFRVSDSDPPRIDPASETIIIEWLSGGHNGGCLAFGPDGCLYISTGDATSPSPPDKRDTGQDIGDLLASILRIDVDRPDAGQAYAIPRDNPFVDVEGARPEIWAYGFRNPWKMSFDRQTGDLWVGDVGWEMFEMVYRVEKGGNYGWSIVEGSQSVRPEAQRGPTPILPPTVEHSHIEARSITGGYVYRGQRLKDLHGAYVYGDYVTGKLWAVRHDGQRVTWQQELCDTPLAVITFAEARDGELLVVDYAGTIHRLVENVRTAANPDFPQTLSATGLFANVKEHAPGAGVIPYSIRVEPWSDGARAERLIAVPGSGRLDYYEESNAQVGNLRGHFRYPPDTVLAKTLSLQTEPGAWRRVETQILHRDGETWLAYTYAWNDEQTDAHLVPAEGLDRQFLVAGTATTSSRHRQTWHFAGRSECLVCHTTRSGSILGFNPAQLDREHDYGGVVDHQVRTLVHVGLFDEPEVRLRQLKIRFAEASDPHDTSLPLDERARAYLHVNCAHCHRRGGGGTATFELLKELRLEKTQAVGERPTQGTFDIAGAEVIAPADPYRSVLLYRMAKLGSGRMPHIGSNVVDRTGVRLIHDWIATLSPELAAGSSGPQGRYWAIRDEQRRLVATLAAEGAAVDATGQNPANETGGESTGNGVATAADSGHATTIDRLLATTSGAMMLWNAVETDALPPTVREAAIARATAHDAPAVRDLFEQYLPEEARTQRLGSVIRPEQILALSGDAERGRRLFIETAGLGCRNCHVVNGNGRELGPDLSRIGGKHDRRQLLESLLEPSKTIEPPFVAYLLETTRGRVHSGLLKERTEREVVLKDSDGRELRVPADEVELLVPQKTSLMPELLLRDLTPTQAADLLEFLSSLK